MTEEIRDILSPIAGGIVGGLVVLLFNHFLTQRRDLDKEQRARDEAAAKQRSETEAALRLSDTEREILRQCVAADGFERGRVWILRVDAFGSWIRAGKHDFMDQQDASLQSRYMDAFESLFTRGYFRSEGRTLFHLSGAGYERAQNDT